MTRNKHFTVQDWEQLETQKGEQLIKVKAEIEVLQNQRAGLLVGMAESEEGAADAVKNAELSITQLEQERESIEALLAILPERKNYARSFEVEKVAEKIQQLDKQFPDLAARIDEAAEAYTLAVKAFLDIMKSGRELGMDLRSYEIGANRALSYYIRKYELSGWLQHFAKGQPISEFITKCPMRTHITAHVEKMSLHAKYLRGEIKGDFKFCPKCYGQLIYDHGKMICKDGCAPD